MTTSDAIPLKPAGRLLVADDDAELLSALTDWLEANGFDATGRASGTAALEALRGGGFDVLLADLIMPGLDGLALLRAGLELDPNLVGLIMTGHGSVPGAVEALKLGAFDYILKPFDFEKVLPTVQRALELRRTRQENVQLRETVALYDLTQSMAARLDVQAVAQQTAAAALAQLAADEAAVLMLAPDGQALVVAAALSASSALSLPAAGGEHPADGAPSALSAPSDGAPTGPRVGQRVPIDQGLAGWIARHGQPLVLNGPIDDARFAPLFPRPEIASAIALPMLAAGQAVGVLTVNLLGARPPLTPRLPFSAGQLKGLSLLANAGAAALENAILVSHLRESESRYRELIEHASDGIVTVNPRGEYVEANSVILKWLGYSRDEFVGRNVREFVPPDEQGQLGRVLDMQRAGQSVTYERRLRRRDGTWLPVEVSASQLPDGSFQAFMRDITERKRSQQALSDSEARLAAIFRTSPAAITVTTVAEGRYLDVNAAFERLMGYTRAELIGHTLAEVGVWPESYRRQSLIAELEQHRPVHNVEQRFRRKTGEMLDVLLSLERVDLGGEPCLVGLLTDVTERKAAERALRESEARFAALFQASPAAISLSTFDGYIVDVNTEFTRSMGYARNEVVGRLAAELGTWAVPEQRENVMRQLAERGSLGGLEVQYRRKSGETMYALSSFETLELAGQRYILTLALDIGDRKAAELALRESEALFAALFQLTPAAITVTELPEGRFVDVNAAAERLLGYSREEALGHTTTELDLWPAHDRQRLLDDLRQNIPIQNREQRFRHKSGALIETLFSAGLVEVAGVKYVISLALDITERKQAEDQLRFQAGLLGAVGQAVIATDPSGRIVYWNHVAERLFGWRQDEAIGQSASIVRPPPAPGETPPPSEAILARVRAGQSWTGEYVVQRRDGTRFTALVTDTPFYDRHGALAGIIGISTDISETKQRQREVEAIAALSAALRGALTRQQIVAAILDQVATLLGASATSLNTLEPASGDLLLEHATGHWADWLGTRSARGAGIVGRVVATSQPYVTADAASDALLDPPASAQGLRALAVVPLIAHGEIIGALSAGRDAPFGDSDLRVLHSLADISANALQRATLHEQTRLRAEQLAAVNELARALAETLQLEQIYERLAAATRQLLPGASAVMISLYDNDLQLLLEVYRARPSAPAAAGSPLAAGSAAPPDKKLDDAQLLNAQAEVIQMRRPVIVNRPPDLSDLLAPLLAKGSVVGVLQAHRDAGRPFTPGEAELLATVANTAAVAIENARLFAETRRRLQHLQAMRTIDLAITSSMDMNISLRVLVDQAARQLEVDAVDVLLLDRESHRLELAAGRGFHSPPPRFALRPDEGNAGRAFMERRLLRVSHLPGQARGGTREAWMLSEGFVTYFGAPLVAKGVVRGVLEVFQRGPLTPDGEWVDFLETLAEQAAIAVDNSGLFAELQRSNTDLELAYDTTLEGWSRALDLRDKETEGHTQRVTDLSERLARSMGVGEHDLLHLRRGALLHDIGKMGIPDSILLKPGPLTDEEWAIMRRHPTYAFELLAPISYLRPALDIPYCHHEKWDGTGYPRGLKGEHIPLAARIFAVVDVWDALRSDRPYRPAWAEDRVRAHLLALSGVHFDPAIVQAFMSMPA